MGGFTESIVGLKELQAKLADLGTKAGHKVVREALLEGGKVLQTAIAERAPERPELPSGTALQPGALRQDIELHIGTADGRPAAIVEPGKYTRHVAGWVEYGHRIVKGGYSRLLHGRNEGKHRGPGHQIGDVPAHPFIRPGYEAARVEAAHVTCAAIAKGITEAGRKK